MKEKVQVVLPNGNIEEQELEKIKAYCPNCKQRWIAYSNTEMPLIKECLDCFVKTMVKKLDSLMESL